MAQLSMKFLNERINSIETAVKSIEELVKTIDLFKNIAPKKITITDNTFELLGLKWTILDKTDNGYMCLAERLEYSMQFDKDTNDWRKSSLRKYLDEVFYKKLIDEIGEDNILSFTRNLTSLDGQTEYGMADEYVSLLTVDEYRKYRKLIPNVNYWWWLITPWSTPCNDYKTSVTVVSPSGIVGCNCCDYGNDGGVRPFCIFSSSIFESEE